MKYRHVSMFISEEMVEKIKEGVWLDEGGTEDWSNAVAFDCLLLLRDRLVDDEDEDSVD